MPQGAVLFLLSPVPLARSFLMCRAAISEGQSWLLSAGKAFFVKPQLCFAVLLKGLLIRPLSSTSRLNASDLSV